MGTSCLSKAQTEQIDTNTPNTSSTQSQSNCMGNKLSCKMSKHVQSTKSKSKQDPMAVDDENTIDLTKEDDVVMEDDDQKDIDPSDSNQNTTNNDDTNNTTNNANDTKIQKGQKGKEDDQSQPVQNQPVAPPPPSQQAQFKYVWQWMENDGTWHDYDTTTQLQLDMLSIGNKITISAGQWTYDITRTATDQCSLCFLYFIHLLPVFTPCPYSVYLLSMYTLCGQSKRFGLKPLNLKIH